MMIQGAVGAERQIAAAYDCMTVPCRPVVAAPSNTGCFQFSNPDEN